MKFFSVLAAAALLAGSYVSAAPAPAEDSADFPLIMETNFFLNQCAQTELKWIGGTPGYNFSYVTLACALSGPIAMLINMLCRMYLNGKRAVTWFDAPNPFSWEVIVSTGTVVRFDVQDSVGRSSSSIPVIVGPGTDNCTLIA
ncbi:hypothetical protein L227DRAFT_611088 [Lentinus tigrinus ALCF2SS1-6]|uniref:Uncharacterized protein n=1 Tax=Lentinus tigrinus ALCF2SS1-6 TaxID=1328759 RepID=A0A5C2SBA5_9APHY|nr:hypothetical protein L227DRAFT_611088 [Lentinus tigrinus ALCF2SS1-6]